MEAILRVQASQFLLTQLNCKYHAPFTSDGSAFLPSMHVEARTRHSIITRVRRQSRGSAVMHVTALLKGDGGDVGGHFEEEWYAMDASQLKILLLQALKKWGVPVAVGAFVGSMIARQAFIFVTSLSFLVCMIAYNVMESHGGQLNSISDVFSRRFFRILLNVSRSSISRISLSLPVVLTACSAAVRLISIQIYLLCASTWTRLCSCAATQQNIQRQHRDLSSSDMKPKVPDSAFESEPKSTDSIIHDINTCIQKLESIVHTEKGPASWKQLRDDLALLKSRVAMAPLKSEGHNASSVGGVGMTSGSTVDGLVKSYKRNRKHMNGGKMQANTVDNVTALKSQVEKQHGLDGVANIEDDTCLHAALLSGEEAMPSMALLALNGATLNQEGGLFSSDFSNKGASTSSKEPPDVVITSKVDESKNGSSWLSNGPQSKHVDYWTQDNQNGSILPAGSSEQSNNWHNLTIAHQREDDLVMAGDRVTEGLQVLKEPKLYPGGKNFWNEGPPLSDLIGGSDQVKVSSTSLKRGNLAECGGQEADGYKSEKSSSETKSNIADHSVSLDTLDVRPMSINKENTACSNGETDSLYQDSVKVELREPSHIRFEKKWPPCETIQEQSSTQQRVSVSNGATNAMEPDITSLGSCKELSFVREDPDMHALTGFSTRRNENEFQRLMAEGEITFRHGKTGLLGKIEVGEAEAMFYKAAELFASAAVMDSSSVEALGFWGNTLLVHGELKLMLSRELKHMICTPDVISSYQTRRSMVSEILDNRNRAELQQTFQAVCEESEELLIQAGRKYRLVLSINKSEIRALYNWGLALCFRAQLITEEGGQNACDAADKVYLAAIDKFEAILGISRRYSPGALLNWGLIIRDRSRLRPMTSTERIDLLQQARQLFQDALRLQPDGALIRSALTTCSIELKELQERKELQSKRRTRSFFGNWQ